MLEYANPATKYYIPDNLDPQKPHCGNPGSKGSLSIRAAAIPEILTKIKYLNESFVSRHAHCLVAVAACVTRWAERWEDSGGLCHKVG